MKLVGVVGFGEIGKSVADLFRDKDDYKVYVTDINKDIISKSYSKLSKDVSKLDTLHICIPVTENFIENVFDYIKKYPADLIIIHSSTVPKTTEKIFKLTKANIVHSPIMGVHPNLTESIKTFKRIIGPTSQEAAELACKFYTDLGIDTELYPTSNDSEMGKLLSTTYYGWNIYFMQRVYEECKQHGLDFDYVYTKTNNIYNEGYNKLNMPHVTRPVLKYMGPGIGKHCITYNALLLYKLNKDLIFPAIIGSSGYNIPEKYTNTPKYKIPDWLFCEYIGKEKSATFIGEECGVSDVTIYKYLKKFGIPIRDNKWAEEKLKTFLKTKSLQVE